LRRALTRKRPFRCKPCGWRGWGVDDGPTFDEDTLRAAALAIAPSPPDLEDTDLTREPPRAQGADSPNLDAMKMIDEALARKNTKT